MMPLRDEDDRHIGFVKIMRDAPPNTWLVWPSAQAKQRRQALLELSDQLAKHNHDTASLADVASGILGRALGVQLVGYGLVDREAKPSTSSVIGPAAGSLPRGGHAGSEDFGSYIEDIKRGAKRLLSAMPEPTRAPAPMRGAGRNQRPGLRQHAGVEHGHLVSLLFVCSATPRQWTNEELLFIARWLHGPARQPLASRPNVPCRLERRS